MSTTTFSSTSLPSQTLLQSTPSYVEDSHSGMIYPSHLAQSLVGLGYLIALCLITIMVRERIPNDLNSFTWKTSMTWARMATMLCLIDSWLFIFVGAFLVLGAGVSYDDMNCEIAIWLCIISYAGSKVFIYLFLMERVHIINSGDKPRLSTWSYRLNLLIIPVWLVILILMMVGRISQLRSDGVCIIGLKNLASIPLMVQDFCVNVYLAGAFTLPVVRGQWRNVRLKNYANKSLMCSIAALTTSLVNILLLTLLHGHQLAWVCLGSCGLDVFINSTILFYITSRVISQKPNRVESRARETKIGILTNASVTSKVFVTHLTNVEVELRDKRERIGRRDSIETPETRMMDISVTRNMDRDSQSDDGPFRNVANDGELGLELGNHNDQNATLEIKM